MTLNIQPRTPGDHPTEDRLLLALEHELTAEEASLVEQHLGTCWSCRARSEEIKRGILAFVDYREKRYLPSLPSPPNDWAGFRARLRSAESAPSLAGTYATLLHRLRAAVFSPLGLTCAAIASAAAVILLLALPFTNPATVSASELLIRAVQAQTPVTHAGNPSRRIAHQTVRIRRGARTVVREFEWKVGAAIPNSQWNTEPDPLSWMSPLTAEGFVEWRNSLDSKKDRVEQSDQFFTLDTTTGVGTIREARMVIRASDYHPMEQHLRFANEQEMDFTEIGFEVRELPVETSRGAVPVVSGGAPASAPRSLPSEASLAETEIQLRYKLFANQWDLGEDLTITRETGQVVLSGTVSSAEREAEMRTDLGGLPNVRLAIRPPAEAGALAPEASRPAAASDPAPGATSLLKDALESAMPSPEERVAFVNRCLSASDMALSHAWAVKVLADRYTAEEQNLLSGTPQQQLREILHAHLEEIRHANGVLDSLAVLLPATERSESPIPAEWRAGFLLLFNQVQLQDRLVASLVAASGVDNSDLTSTARLFSGTHQTIWGLLDELANATRAQ